jgi:acetate kinase
MREIQQQASLGIEHARLALDMFCYRIKKYIGAYIAVLGSVDAVVFTGGIGENSAVVRKRVCAGMEPMGIALDDERNEAASGKVSEIQREGGPLKLLVIRTDEELEIARGTVQAIRKANSIQITDSFIS